MSHPIRIGLVLATLGTACIGISCGRSSAARDDAGKEVAATFLREIGAGRVDPAWQATTVEFKSLMGSDSLRDYARNHPALKGTAEFLDSHPIEASGGRMVEYRFRATPPPARSKPKNAPGPTTFRVMVDSRDDPPKVERLAAD